MIRLNGVDNARTERGHINRFARTVRRPQLDDPGYDSQDLDIPCLTVSWAQSPEAVTSRASLTKIT